MFLVSNDFKFGLIGSNRLDVFGSIFYLEPIVLLIRSGTSESTIKLVNRLIGVVLVESNNSNSSILFGLGYLLNGSHNRLS